MTVQTGLAEETRESRMTLSLVTSTRPAMTALQAKQRFAFALPPALLLFSQKPGVFLLAARRASLPGHVQRAAHASQIYSRLDESQRRSRGQCRTNRLMRPWS
jgi:hypothetical protein